MNKFTIFILIAFFSWLCSCGSSRCDKKGKAAKRGFPYNGLRMQYGVPIIHDYMCFDRGTMKTEGWDAPVSYQLSAVNGFHAGKAVFLQSEAELDEKDIYRHRIDDSTFEFVGILTEVHNAVVSFPNIWYGKIDITTITGGHTERIFANTKTDLSIEQADSILSKWGTGRR